MNSSNAPLLLSYSKAARMLGVSRNGTLHAIIKAGLLSPVRVLGRWYIPREQVEQLGRKGEHVDTKTTAPKQKVHRGGSIADLDIF